MAKELTEDQVNDALITLKQKEVDEQIRSNKVIEGVLKDICNAAEDICNAVERNLDTEY